MVVIPQAEARTESQRRKEAVKTRSQPDHSAIRLEVGDLPGS